MFAYLLQLFLAFRNWLLSLFLSPQPDLERGGANPGQAPVYSELKRGPLEDANVFQISSRAPSPSPLPTAGSQVYAPLLSASPYVSPRPSLSIAQEDRDDSESLAALRTRLRRKQARAPSSPNSYLDSPPQFKTARPSSRVLPSQDPHRWSDTQASSILSSGQSCSSELSSCKNEELPNSQSGLLAAFQELTDRVRYFESFRRFALAALGQAAPEDVPKSALYEMRPSKSSGCFLQAVPENGTLRHRRVRSQPGDIRLWRVAIPPKKADIISENVEVVSPMKCLGTDQSAPTTPTTCKTTTLEKPHDGGQLDVTSFGSTPGQELTTPQASPRCKWDVDTSRSLRKPLPMQYNCTEAFRFPANTAAISPCASLSACSSASLRPLMSFSIRASWCNDMKAFKSPRESVQTSVSGRYSVSLLASSPSETSCFGEIIDGETEMVDRVVSTPTKVQPQARRLEAISETPIQDDQASTQGSHETIPSHSSLPAFGRAARAKEVRRSLQFWPNFQSDAMQTERLFRGSQPLPPIPEITIPATPGLCDSSDGSTSSLLSTPSAAFPQGLSPDGDGFVSPSPSGNPGKPLYSASSSVYTIIAKSPSAFLRDGELVASFSYSKFIAEVEQRNKELHFGSNSSWDFRFSGMGKEGGIGGKKNRVSVVGPIESEEWADVFSLTRYA